MIKIYQHYFEELEESIPKLLNADFVIAFISSPFRANVENLKNAYAIKIYFTHITSKDIYSYVYAWDALSSIFLGHLFNINTGSSLTKPWEDTLDKKYNYTKEFNVNLEKATVYLTLKELHKKYRYYVANAQNQVFKK